MRLNLHANNLQVGLNMNNFEYKHHQTPRYAGIYQYLLTFL